MSEIRTAVLLLIFVVCAFVTSLLANKDWNIGALFGPETATIEQRDLASRNIDAQERMARAAEKTALYTGIQALVGLFGTLAVLGALFASLRGLKLATKQADAASEANAIARENAHAERRPWIAIDAQLEAMGFTSGREDFRVDFTISLKNVGQTPATEIVTLHAIVKAEGPRGAYSADHCTDFQRRLRNWRIGIASVVFPHQSVTLHMSVIEATNEKMRMHARTKVYLITGVRYESAQGREPHITTQLIDLGYAECAFPVSLANRDVTSVNSYAD